MFPNFLHRFARTSSFSKMMGDMSPFPHYQVHTKWTYTNYRAARVPQTLAMSLKFSCTKRFIEPKTPQRRPLRKFVHASFYKQIRRHERVGQGIALSISLDGKQVWHKLKLKNQHPKGTFLPLIGVFALLNVVSVLMPNISNYTCIMYAITDGCV